MKILILANNDVGLYKFRKELISELIAPGSFLDKRKGKANDVYISVPDGEMVYPLKKIGCKFIDTPVDRRGINPFTDLKLLLKYKEIFNKVKPDLIITYTIKPNIYGGLVARLKHVPYVENITGLGSVFEKESIIKKLVVWLYKIALKKAKIVFFENDENKEEFVNLNIIPEAKTCKLNGAGVNLDDYPFSSYPNEKEEIRFLFIGRVMKEKGVDELFEVAAKMKQEYPNVQFDIVGPYEEDYQAKVEDLKRKGIINYYGFQPDVKPFIEHCHCFVLPSYHEGMANTLLESAAMGRPLITSNIHGCQEAVIESDNGFLCESKDILNLYLIIKRFINLPYDQKSDMGKRSRMLIEQKFDKKDIIQATLSFISTLVVEQINKEVI